MDRVSARLRVQRLLAEEGIVVLCDYRESSVARELEKLDVVVKEFPLEVGDFIVSERVVIERKSSRDFVKSIIDGRIFEQARAMRDSFQKPILIVEGREPPIGISQNALRGAVASLILDFDTSVLHARDERDTAHLIYWLARREQIEAGKKVAIRARRKPKELRRLQEEIVAGLPGVSSVLAKRLLARFNTIQRVFVASEAQLKKVRGIGEKLAKRIRRVLTASYGT